MRAVTFSDADLEMIAHERYHHPDPQVQRKMEVLWLLHHGETHERIATLAGISRSSVHRYLTDYLEGGLDLIRRCPHKGSVSQLDAQQASLEEYFDKHPPHTVKEAQQVIEQRTGIRRGLTQVRRFLKRLGLKPRKACAIPVPPKSTLEEQAEKQAELLEDKLEPRLAEARAGRRQVRFVDASHFVFATFLGAMTTARWFGPAALDRYGRVPVARVLVVLAIAGLVLFIFGPGIGLALLGALLWGTGTSLGFPMGMSAGADEPALAASRVGVITTIGYSAFLAGPPLIGFLGQRFSVPHALIAVIVMLIVAGLIAGSVRPRTPPIEQMSN